MLKMPSELKAANYRIEWGEGRCHVTAATWHDAIRCAFHGVVAWDRVPDTSDGLPAVIIVSGGSDARGGMVCTLKNAIETVLGVCPPAQIQVADNRVEAANMGV